MSQENDRTRQISIHWKPHHARNDAPGPDYTKRSLKNILIWSSTREPSDVAHKDIQIESATASPGVEIASIGNAALVAAAIVPCAEKGGLFP
jgi:hypothetical protein